MACFSFINRNLTKKLYYCMYYKFQAVTNWSLTVCSTMDSSRIWSPKKRAVAVTLKSEGYTYQQIANRIGGKAAHSGVLKLCGKFYVSNSVLDKPRLGRRRISTEREDRYLVRMCLVDRQKTSTQLQQEWKADGCSSTVRRCLIKNGLNGRIPRKKPFLNQVQRAKRVQWAKEHQSRTVDEWAKVLWSDESKIFVFGSDGIHYVRRRLNEQLSPQCILPTMKHPLSVMIWGCMSAKGVERLHMCEGTVNGQKYRDDILSPKMLHFARDLFLDKDSPDDAIPDFVFQQDSVPCHTANIVQKWFTENNITTLSWPGNSRTLTL